MRFQNILKTFNFELAKKGSVIGVSISTLGFIILFLIFFFSKIDINSEPEFVASNFILAWLWFGAGMAIYWSISNVICSLFISTYMFLLKKKELKLLPQFAFLVFILSLFFSFSFFVGLTCLLIILGLLESLGRSLLSDRPVK